MAAEYAGEGASLPFSSLHGRHGLGNAVAPWTREDVRYRLLCYNEDGPGPTHFDATRFANRRSNLL
jgi:hypothetical protein